jgi:type II secretory pathway component HofQ
MKAGHTLALAGDYREEVEDESRGLPHLMHSPLWGPLFRTVKEKVNETELVFMITPRFISEVDPTAVPNLGVGQLTESPSNHELYINGYLEVPRCQDECPTNDRFDDPATQYAPQIQRSIQQNTRQPASLSLPGRDLNNPPSVRGSNGNRSVPYRPRSYQMVPTPAVTPPSQGAIPQPITGSSRIKAASAGVAHPYPNQVRPGFYEPTNGPPNSN